MFIKQNLLICLLCFIPLSSFASVCQLSIGGGQFGPFDYTSAVGKVKVKLVEPYHFTPQVERLISGESSSIEKDLDYTLRAFPNHHRALFSVARYYVKKAKQPLLANQEFRTFECFIKLAKQFSPQDKMLFIIEGFYFHKLKEYDKALASYIRADTESIDSIELYYNIGLLFLEMGDEENAEVYARKAYNAEAPYPLMGLKNMLMKRGIDIQVIDEIVVKEK